MLLIDDEPWFVLADLCRVLGLDQISRVKARLDDALTRITPIADALGRTQQATIVSEPGMYEVVIRSDKPDAITFRRWITSEVLPQIRRTGSYNAAPQLTGKQLLAAGLLEADRVMKEQAATIGAQRAELELAAPKVHWRSLGEGKRKGPRSFALEGGSVRYRRTDVEAWLQAQYEAEATS
ncbi:MAG TPA: BRO family protein [Micropruina sp.]|nr:BRO family protein [Micropruina sp.]